MQVKNTLSDFLKSVMVMNNNGLETIDKIGDAVTSTEDTVYLTLTDPNDSSSTVKYAIPSFSYLKSEIDRLSASLDTMTNVTKGAGSRIRLSDGSYRKIIASKIPSEAPTISTVDRITNFNFKANWFFEDMLNPSLYITWDMSNQISEDTERVMIQRYILRCDTQKKRDVFNNTLKGRNDIDYRDFLSLLLNYSIMYTLDDEVKDLPPRSKRYFGTFSVIRIENEKDLEGNTVKRYILDSLEFTDSRSGFENTRLLSVGDFVEVNTDPTTTRYEVIFVDASENKIGLKCVEGCDGVKIGADTLKISASQDTTVSADIPIGFDEREVIFIKAIDPDSNIPSNKWSPGVAFYSNELTYVDSTGSTQTLQKFYQKNVVDFGQVLLSYASDYYPSIREGLIPDAPVLNYSNGEGDFKIVQINMQLTESADSASLRSLISDKAKVKSEIDNLTNEISKQKEIIQTTQYTSTNEKLNAQSTLDTLISTQETLVSNYNSIVNNIKAKYESSASYSPKYRVRGFWDIPESKVSPSSGEQKIIKFKIRYRYLNESGNTNKEEEFTYNSGNSTVTGRFSNWNEIESKLRPRVKTTSGWEWENIDTTDPDAVNINQLDIPINQGEQVEIQVKSVSEAGWPSNPLESEWSNAITVSFTDFAELEADDISSLIDQNRVDAAVGNITQMFAGIGNHMSTSFYTNDKYFAHSAESITSGFLSPEQTPITLYDKVKEMDNEIRMLNEIINGITGDINVNLIDNSDEQKIHTLNEGSTTYVNAGNYLSEIASLDSSKKNGAIVTKTFYVDISTEAQSGLYLLSKLTGDRLSMCPSSIDENEIDNPTENGNDYSAYDNVISPSTTSSQYYLEQGRYDLVPINLTNPEFLDFQIGSPNMYQSAQCRGQFIYSRFRNIGDTFDMYANTIDAKGNPAFDYAAPFLDSEVSMGTNYSFSDDYYTQDEKNVLNYLMGFAVSGSSFTPADEVGGGETISGGNNTCKIQYKWSISLLDGSIEDGGEAEYVRTVSGNVPSDNATISKYTYCGTDSSESANVQDRIDFNNVHCTYNGSDVIGELGVCYINPDDVLISDPNIEDALKLSGWVSNENAEYTISSSTIYGLSSIFSNGKAYNGDLPGLVCSLVTEGGENYEVDRFSIDVYATFEVTYTEGETVTYYNKVKLVDQDGTPVNGNVTIYESLSSTNSTVMSTDLAGKCTIYSGSENKTYYVTGSAVGYQSAVSGKITVNSSTDEDAYTKVTLKSPYYFNVRVMDASTSSPISGATVKLYESATAADAEIEGTTDSSGKFSKNFSTHETLYADVTADGYDALEQRVGLDRRLKSSAVQYTDIALNAASSSGGSGSGEVEPGGSESGDNDPVTPPVTTTKYYLNVKVADSGSNPIAGATISIYDSKTGGNCLRTVTLTDGSISIEYSSSGTYYVSASASGYKSKERVAVSTTSNAGLYSTITLSKEKYYINVQVVDGDGMGVQFATIMGYDSETSSSSKYHGTITSADGKHSAEVNQGTVYYIVASHVGYSSNATRVRVSAVSNQTEFTKVVLTIVQDSGNTNKDMLQAILDSYNSLTGSNVKYADLSSGAKTQMYAYLNRLPKTWQKADTSSVKTLSDNKVLVRLNKYNSSVAENTTRLVNRIQNLTSSNSSAYTVIPKIQAAYGFANLGACVGHDKISSVDSGSFLTTHKIGYEDRDRYAIGEDTCNSYLFMSPVNHSEIQVDGDTIDATKLVKSTESLRVPIIYQFRMTDYNGDIFGKKSNTETLVKNAKFANIIGLDIWTNRNALKPKQYDIVIYSTYGSTVETNTGRTKTSTQTLVNAATKIANKLDQMTKDSKTISTI